MQIQIEPHQTPDFGLIRQAAHDVCPRINRFFLSQVNRNSWCGGSDSSSGRSGSGLTSWGGEAVVWWNEQSKFARSEKRDIRGRPTNTIEVVFMQVALSSSGMNEQGISFAVLLQFFSVAALQIFGFDLWHREAAVVARSLQEAPQP